MSIVVAEMKMWLIVVLQLVDDQVTGRILRRPLDADAGCRSTVDDQAQEMGVAKLC